MKRTAGTFLLAASLATTAVGGVVGVTGTGTAGADDSGAFSAAEARSGKMNVWEFLVAPGLRDKGKSTGEIAQLFDVQNEDAKDYAYGLAEEIKKELDARRKR